MAYIIVVAMLGYLVYKEYSFNKTLKDLTLKLMSKNVSDYTFASNPIKETKREPEPFIPIEDSEAWGDYEAFTQALKESNGKE